MKKRIRPYKIRYKPHYIPLEPISCGPVIHSRDEIEEATARFKAQGNTITHLNPQITPGHFPVRSKKSLRPCTFDNPIEDIL